MAKLYCLHCREESETREDLCCPHCGARGKWAHPVEDPKSEAPSEKRVDSLRISNPKAITRLFEKLSRYGARRHAF